jgi:hypothetical protein
LRPYLKNKLKVKAWKQVVEPFEDLSSIPSTSNKQKTKKRKEKNIHEALL